MMASLVASVREWASPLWAQFVAELAEFNADVTREGSKLWDRVQEVVSTAQDTVRTTTEAENVVSAVIILWFAIGLLRMIFARRIATFEDYNLFDFRGTFYTTQLLASVAVALFPERLASVLPYAEWYAVHRLLLHLVYSAAALVVAVGVYLLWIWRVHYVFHKMRREAAARAAEPSKSRPLQRIAICHVSIGAGHKRAAQALEEVLRERDPNLDVRVVDMLDFSTGGRDNLSFYTLVAKKGYMSLIQYKLGATLYGYFFENSNTGSTSNNGWVASFFSTVQRAFFLSFYEFIFSFRPDIVISTHFLAPDLIAQLKRDGNFDVPHVTVVTDFDAHRVWAHMPVTKYFAPREEAALMLQHCGVPRDIVQLCGIPIVPAFANLTSKAQCREALELDADMPMVLLMSGGRDVFEIYPKLLTIKTPAQIIVITGRQADVRTALAKHEVPERHVVKLEGFTTRMHDYLMSTDLIVSKPGGLTTAESMATGTPMVIVNPIPGQETRNTDMLLEAGAAIKINDLPLLAYQVDQVLGNAQRLRTMQRNALALGDPHAAHKIVDAVVDLHASVGGVDPGTPRANGTSTDASAAASPTRSSGGSSDGGGSEDTGSPDREEVLRRNREKLRQSRAGRGGRKRGGSGAGAAAGSADVVETNGAGAGADAGSPRKPKRATRTSSRKTMAKKSRASTLAAKPKVRQSARLRQRTVNQPAGRR